jgi:uncharacterized protein (DUF2147 family)
MSDERRCGPRECRAGGFRGEAARLLFGIVFAVALATAFAGGTRADDPFGTWMRPSTGTQVNFYNCGGKLCGNCRS